MTGRKPTRAEKFQMLNDRIREARIAHAAAVASGDAKGITEAIRAMRKARGRIAALPRAMDERPKLGIVYSPKFYRA